MRITNLFTLIDGVTVAKSLRNVPRVHGALQIKRRSFLLSPPGLLGILLALSLAASGLRNAIACDEICDDPNFNTGFGTYQDDAGVNNSAFGYAALSSNLGGSDNTAFGSFALDLALGGVATKDTAVGSEAMYGSGTASYCVAVGYYALNSSTGNYNTALGYATAPLRSGSFNTATGAQALAYQGSGNSNTANGAFALYYNLSGGLNTGVGRGALFRNMLGSNNTAVGYQALHQSSGDNNIALGSSAGANLTAGSNNIDIGGPGVAGESNTIRIGKVGTQTAVYIHGIYGATASEGVSVFVDSSGHLGTTTSSARFKENIQPMDKTSEAILALKPVTFRYKKKLDPNAIPQFGLVAEQVEKIDPDLVVRDEQGKAYSVRYEAVNAMLLNEFLKAHRRIEEQDRRAQQQECTAMELRSQIQALTSALKEQAAQVQKVSAQVQANLGAAHLVATKH